MQVIFPNKCVCILISKHLYNYVMILRSIGMPPMRRACLRPSDSVDIITEMHRNTDSNTSNPSSSLVSLRGRRDLNMMNKRSANEPPIKDDQTALYIWIWTFINETRQTAHNYTFLLEKMMHSFITLIQTTIRIRIKRIIPKERDNALIQLNFVTTMLTFHKRF